ncbi:hypothetical protein VTI74DRAFT_2250 [Chaetomium olivicolor]
MCTGTLIHFWCPCPMHLPNEANPPEALGHAVTRSVTHGIFAWCDAYLHSPQFAFSPDTPGTPPDCPGIIDCEHMHFRSSQPCAECQRAGCIVLAPGDRTPRGLYGYRSSREKADFLREHLTKRARETEKRRVMAEMCKEEEGMALQELALQALDTSSDDEADVRTIREGKWKKGTMPEWIERLKKREQSCRAKRAEKILALWGSVRGSREGKRKDGDKGDAEGAEFHTTGKRI